MADDLGAGDLGEGDLGAGSSGSGMVMDGLIGILGVAFILLLIGGAIGLTCRAAFSPRWLAVAGALVVLNDFLLTRGYGTLPHLLPRSEWNWQGKLLALGATLAVAWLPQMGWAPSGLTFAQTRGSLKRSAPVVLLYCLFFVAIALVFPSDPPSTETVAFQLTMPGLEEEPFYRGVLLLALNRAFTARVRFLAVDWGWGAILSCVLFGLAHAFGHAQGGFTFDPIIMALTALPSIIAVWLRLITGSVVLPTLLHNFGNSISLIL